MREAVTSQRKRMLGIDKWYFNRFLGFHKAMSKYVNTNVGSQTAGNLSIDWFWVWFQNDVDFFCHQLDVEKPGIWCRRILLPSDGDAAVSAI